MSRTRLLSTREAALRAGVTQSTIRQWSFRGYLDQTGERVHLRPAGYVGRWPRYLEADVLAAERDTRLFLTRRPRMGDTGLAPGQEGR